MMTNPKIAAALAGGYLLGRTGKGKLALTVALMLAGRKISLNPQDLARTVADSPVLSGLSDQVRKDLVAGTKSAAGSALEARLNSFADSLSDRTRALAGDSGTADHEKEENGENGEDEENEADERQPERDEEPAPAPRARRGTSSTARSAKKTAGTARKTAPAGTARTAKKTARTAGSTTSRTARTSRGGRDD
jgi:hypothetical protein